MTHIPNVHLMIHADNLQYVDNVLRKIPKELLFNFTERVIFVQRSKAASDTQKMKKWCKEVFGDKEKTLVWDEKAQFFKADQPDGPTYDRNC